MLMEMFIRDNGKMIVGMARVRLCMEVLVIDMLGNGRIINAMGKVVIIPVLKQ